MKYDLARMLEEIKRDERGGKGAEKRKVLTQEEIKALSRGRRKGEAAKSPAK
jgi:hypothetical protein